MQILLWLTVSFRSATSFILDVLQFCYVCNLAVLMSPSQMNFCLGLWLHMSYTWDCNRRVAFPLISIIILSLPTIPHTINPIPGKYDPQLKVLVQKPNNVFFIWFSLLLLTMIESLVRYLLFWCQLLFQLDEHITVEVIWIYDTKHSTNLPIAAC